MPGKRKKKLKGIKVDVPTFKELVELKGERIAEEQRHISWTGLMRYLLEVHSQCVTHNPRRSKKVRG